MSILNPIYNKPYFLPEEIIRTLQQKGLHIEDKESAEKFLTNISYYRFKIYLRPFLNQSSQNFKQGASFEKALQIYRFDAELRDLLFSLIGRIEVKIRTRLDQTITQHTQDPFWYLNSHNFSSSATDHRPGLNNTFMKSTDDFVKHYKAKYRSPENISVFHSKMPPFWIMAELTTFGDIVSLFKALNKEKFSNKHNNLLDTLSQEFGASTLDIFNSWLQSLRETRNRCAHHSRLWNRNCVEVKGIQGKNSRLQIKPERHNRLYSALFVIHHISKNIGIERNVKNEFLELLKKYPEVNKRIESVGFPMKWNRMNVWNK